ncbi:MAG: hypothetical protein AAGL24_29285 [Pseudomonadota bacterium]
MALLATGLLFLVFIANIGLGAFTGSRMFGDVPEMLVLFAASICFVAAILRREADVKKNNSEQ